MHSTPHLHVRSCGAELLLIRDGLSEWECGGVCRRMGWEERGEETVGFRTWGEHMHMHHGQPIKCVGAGVEQLCKEHITRRENPPPQLAEHQPPHAPQPHEDPPHTNTHAYSVPGEWTSFLFAILEGDGTGGTGWYELGAQEYEYGRSERGAGYGGAQVGVEIGAQNRGMGGAGMGMSMGAGGQGVGLGASQTVSTGEADSTLRFALIVRRLLDWNTCGSPFLLYPLSYLHSPLRLIHLVTFTSSPHLVICTSSLYHTPQHLVTHRTSHHTRPQTYHSLTP
ncbi:hypothetical protein F4604DRAFT_1927231 [Suillus subluteus]|nr:hypothetical protein F4604DRAFT_1927231 [Suillus subluteus]